MTNPVVLRHVQEVQSFSQNDSDFVILDVAPSLQETVLEALAHRVRAGSTVLFNVGKLASVALQETAQEQGLELAETNADLFASSHRPVFVACRTPQLTDSAVDTLREHYPQVLAAGSAQECALNDPMAVIGPVTLLLNLSRVEQMGPYRTASADVTKAVGRVLDAVDKERLRLARAAGCRAHSLAELLGVAPGGAHQAVQKSGLWQRHMSPDSVEHAHFSEELPYSVAAWVELGEARGVPAPHLQSLLVLAGTALGRAVEARRSFLGDGQSSAEAAAGPSDDGLLLLGLEETVESRPAARTVSLTEATIEVSVQAKSRVVGMPTGEIAESFENLRRALEEKLSGENA